MPYNQIEVYSLNADVSADAIESRAVALGSVLTAKAGSSGGSVTLWIATNSGSLNRLQTGMNWAKNVTHYSLLAPSLCHSAHFPSIAPY